MFFELIPRRIGFTEKEWEKIPKGQRRLIRDYHLNGCDKMATINYRYDDTDFEVRRTIKIYHLEERPTHVLNAEDFCLV